MWHKIKGWLAPPVFEDEEKTRAANLLNIIVIGLLLLFAVFAGMNLFALQDAGAEIIFISVLLLAFLAIYSLMRFGFISQSAVLFVAIFWSIHTLAVINTGGVRDPAVATYLLVTIIAGLLLGGRSSMIVAGASLLVVGGMFYAESIGLLIYPAERYTTSAALIVHIFNLIVVGILLYLYTRELNQMVRRLRREERELNESNKELKAIRGTLEERVTARIRGLELVATLSERLTGILDFDQLLVELVNQVKEGFGYYHVHIYILDEQRQDLIMTVGTGEAGAQMKAEGHHILLNAPTSLVARAARSGEIVNVSNVRQNFDWLPNPLLPDTHSEIAVPIIVDNRVVGVLDVQEDKIVDLGEGDTSLLRSLANQVGVAIRNAHLFDEVETALTEAQTAQERYISQSWQQTGAASQHRESLYTRSDMAELSAATLDTATALALAQKHPAIVAIDNYEGSPQALLAPISLAGQTIGTLQLHKMDSEDTSQLWTEQDLEFVETILDQVAQSVENLRLFEETRQRADREHLIGEITQKLRQAPSLDALAQVAAEELGSALGVSRGVVKVGVSPAGYDTVENSEKK